MYEQYADSPGKIAEVSAILDKSGSTITEAMDAVSTGKKPAPPLDGTSTTTPIVVDADHMHLNEDEA